MPFSLFFGMVCMVGMYDMVRMGKLACMYRMVDMVCKYGIDNMVRMCYTYDTYDERKVILLSK